MLTEEFTEWLKFNETTIMFNFCNIRDKLCGEKAGAAGTEHG